MSRAWDLLKGKKSREVTGSNIEGVGSSIFIQPENKSALSEWEMMSKAAGTLAFRGGLPQPDSITLYEVTIAQNTTTFVKPSDIFSTEPNASGYVCILLGAAVIGSADGVNVTPVLADGSVSVPLAKATAATTSVAVPVDFPTYSYPIYFTEDTYLGFTESANASAGKGYLRVAIMVRGGNPQ